MTANLKGTILTSIDILPIEVSKKVFIPIMSALTIQTNFHFTHQGEHPTSPFLDQPT